MKIARNRAILGKFGEKNVGCRQEFCAEFALKSLILSNFGLILGILCPKWAVFAGFGAKICDAVPGIFLHFQRKRPVFGTI